MAVSFLGVIAALAMYAVSVAPSLMARSWAWHAVASGVLVSCGYVAGVVVQNVGARVIAMTGLTIRASEPVEIGFRVSIAALFAIWWLYAVIQSYRRARVAARLVNMPGETFGEYLLGTAGTVVIAWCLIAIVAGLNRLGRMLIGVLGGYMPRPAAIVVGVAILAATVFFLPWSLVAAFLTFRYIKDVPLKANIKEQMDIFGNLDIMDKFTNNVGIVSIALILIVILDWVLRRIDEFSTHLNMVSSFRVGTMWRICVVNITTLVLGFTLFQELFGLFKEPRVVPARELAGASNVLFRRNSQSGAVEALARGGKSIELGSPQHPGQ